MGVRTGRVARSRGTVHVCDSGSSHILTTVRLMTEEHERLGFPWKPLHPDAIERELIEYSEADAITVPSIFAYESFLSHGVPREKLLLVPYGVDVSQFRRTEPRAPEFRVLFVGNHTVRKGLQFLLKAFKRAALPNSRLVLVGPSWPDGEAVLRLFPVEPVERLGKLSWAGVAREMSRASVLVLPSLDDGFGLVMAQAMACGCPVIASEHTGSRDLFTDGREGFTVPVGDVEAIADRLQRLHRDRDLLESMSAAAVERTRSMGGWDSYGARMAEELGALVRRRRGSAPSGG